MQQFDLNSIERITLTPLIIILLVVLVVFGLFTVISLLSGDIWEPAPKGY